MRNMGTLKEGIFTNKYFSCGQRGNRKGRVLWRGQGGKGEAKALLLRSKIGSSPRKIVHTLVRRASRHLSSSIPKLLQTSGYCVPPTLRMGMF